MALFGVLERADPALVDPGVTAELECLLDDVVTGRQEMMGAIDAVCDAARRIIGSLGDGAVAGEAVELGMALDRENGGEQPPTAAMKKFAASIARHKGIKPPAGYTKSGAICRGEKRAPDRRVQRRCRLPRRSRGKRTSLFQTRPGSALMKCRHGSMRTGNRSLQRAARRQRPVTAPPRRRGRKREQKHRGRGNLQAPQKRWHNPATPGRVRRRARHCEFLTETRRLHSSSAPDTRQAAGMRRPASILWHSASANGCDLRPHPTYVDAPFWCKQNFVLHVPPQMAEYAVRSARRAYGCYSAPKFDPLESRSLKRLAPRWALNRRAEQQPKGCQSGLSPAPDNRDNPELGIITGHGTDGKM